MRLIYNFIFLSLAFSLAALQHAEATDVVGSPTGQFAVSPTGAATYSIPIDVPPGIGGMQPQISIVYNSQSGMGNVGWGCSISGLSAITRGVKDIYHDGQAKGLRYEDDDAYFLDGKRLVHVSGVEGALGCLYHPEGEPFTDVTVKSGSGGKYFEVKTPEGNTAVYGDIDNSRVVFNSGGQKVAAWHIHTVTNSVGRSLSYTYDNTDYYPCVSKIGYYNGDSGSHCWIDFSYTPLNDAAQKFRLMDVEGKIDKRLTEINCKVGSVTLRNYTFTYDTSSDGTTVKYPRLTAINVSDGNGNSLRPVMLTWNHLPAFSYPDHSELTLGASFPSGFQITDRMYMSGDMNGDGISDLVLIATDQKSSVKNSYLSWLQSYRNNYGEIDFWPSEGKEIGPSFKTKHLTSQHSYHFGDVDGDGLLDFLLPHLETDHIGGTSNIDIVPVYGNKGRLNALPNDTSYIIPLSEVTDEMPSYAVSDINNDGISEILVFEHKTTNFRPCHLITVDTTHSYDIQTETYSLQSVPKKLFLEDFNGNGLQDMLVICKDGYKLYWNRGSLMYDTIPDLFHHFNDGTGNWVTGTDIQDVQDIVTGDFNGDGLADLLLHGHNSKQYTMAVNKGDGSFTKYLINLNFGDQQITDDNLSDKFTILTADFDHDGKSDLFLAHDYYDYHGGFQNEYEYIRTDVRWYRSTGTSFSLIKSVQTKNENDAEPGHVTFGDIDGDGLVELISYGSDITTSSTTERNVRSHFYGDGMTPLSGKVSSITDGFGNTTQVSYASLTSPTVYTKGTGCTYPLVDLAVPMHVVNSVTTPTVATSSPSMLMTETYTYEGLKAHVAGRGLLGFSKTTVSNDVMGTTAVNESSGWTSNDYFVPTGTTTTTYLGSVGSSTHSTTTTALTVANKNSGTRKNFFTYPTAVTATDFDNYTTATTYTYDTAKGVPTLEKTVYDGNASTNYKQVAYTYGSTKQGGRWLPVQTVTTQRHPDGPLAFSTTQTVTYDASTGLPTQVVENAHNASLKLTTAYTYDSWGNLTSKAVSGQGLNTVTTNYAYDSSRRFVASVTTSPASTVTTYTYDLWGNVLTETDATVASSPLTTTNTYDGFGNLLTSTSPEGIVTTTSRTWGTSPTGKYCVSTTTPGQPYTLTWYDSRGRKVSEETAGAGGTANLTQYRYDERGNLSFSSRAVVDGPPGLVQAGAGLDGTASPDVAPPSDPPSLDAVYLTTTMAYDGRGRLTSETHSTGKSTTYSYTGRKVTATTNGRVYEKTYDAWGLLKQSKEPVGTVSYLYHSCGKPRSASTGSNPVTMAYDNCGNQVSLNDPDAGTTSYTYNAAGEVVSQTDARGITTTHTRDALNRITKTTTGTTEVSYAYGTSGNAAQRLTQFSSGNYGISYAYDQYGRVTAETRNFGSTQYATAYTYDADGHLATATYPGSVQVTYGYDSYGFENSMSVNGSSVWTLTSHSPQATVEQLGTGSAALRRSTARNQYGLLTGITLQKVSNSSTLHQMTFTHDAVTGNLTRRTGMVPSITGESFSYDALDRLVYYYDHRAQHEAVCQYDNTGNIEFKTYYGYYGYRPTSGLTPHGVKQVDNTSGYISDDDQTVTYNDLGKASEIYTAHGSSGHLYLDYGPDGQRWKTQLYKSSTAWPDTVRYYVGDMEGVETGPSGITWTYHLGHGVILRKYGLSAGIQPTVYYTFTDNLGSVTRIYNSSGTAVFSAYYDPWGVQTVTTNTIGYNRGYCGHEMLNDFQLINMNGRMYDPYIARFLSPDNYVQLPTSAQSFNRYSYCLNNPLKYTDPSGELFGIDDVLLLTIATNAYTSAVTGAFKASMQGRSVFEGALRGAGSSLISSIGSMGVGAYFGHGGGTLLNELLRAGAHGIVGGTASLISGDGFAPGFISGSLSSLGTSAVQALGANSIVGAGVSMGIGALSANLSGGNWMMGAMEGLNSALLNHYGGNHGGGNWLPEVVVYGYQGILSSVHAVLDIAGMIPCIGEFADGANAIMYTIQGDFSNAGISAAAMVPVLGNFATGGKIAAKAVNVYTKSSLKFGRDVHNLYRVKEADGVMKIKECTKISKIRPDFVDFDSKTIYELKPNNPRGIRSGLKQLAKYKAAYESRYGHVWKTVLDLY